MRRQFRHEINHLFGLTANLCQRAASSVTKLQPASISFREAGVAQTAVAFFP